MKIARKKDVRGNGYDSGAQFQPWKAHNHSRIARNHLDRILGQVVWNRLQFSSRYLQDAFEGSSGQLWVEAPDPDVVFLLDPLALMARDMSCLDPCAMQASRLHTKEVPPDCLNRSRHLVIEVSVSGRIEIQIVDALVR